MLIQGVPIHGICLFKDVIETAVRELAERTNNAHSFVAYLYKHSAHSERTY